VIGKKMDDSFRTPERLASHPAGSSRVKHPKSARKRGNLKNPRGEGATAADFVRAGPFFLYFLAVGPIFSHRPRCLQAKFRAFGGMMAQ